MQKLIDYIKANPGMVIIVIVAGLMGWNMINVIRQNYEYQQRADKIADDISLMELENEKLKYNIEYYKTDSYLEQRARESLNLRAPGEKVIVVPKRKTAAEKQPQEERPPSRIEQYKQNLQDWKNLFSGRARPGSR